LFGCSASERWRGSLDPLSTNAPVPPPSQRSDTRTPGPLAGRWVKGPLRWRYAPTCNAVALMVPLLSLVPFTVTCIAALRPASECTMPWNCVAVETWTVTVVPSTSLSMKVDVEVSTLPTVPTNGCPAVLSPEGLPSPWLVPLPSFPSLAFGFANPPTVIFHASSDLLDCGSAWTSTLCPRFLARSASDVAWSPFTLV